MPLIFTDADIDPARDMAAAIEAIEAVLSERTARTAAVQPRSQLGIHATDLTLTPGVLGSADLSGVRVVPAAGGGSGQLVAVWRRSTGTLRALFHGSLLGTLRTGAIGAAAMERLAQAGPAEVGVIGTGPQALMQLVAAREVGRLGAVRLYRRNVEALRSTAESWSKELAVPVQPAVSAKQAVEGAAIVILATTSTVPVVKAGWITPDAYVASLGPKRRGATELSPQLVMAASRVVTDFPEQVAASDDPLTSGTRHGAPADLAAVGSEAPSPVKGPTLFLSMGLAGTEVAVAARLEQRLRQCGLGAPLPAPDGS